MLQFKVLHMECFIYHVYLKKTSSPKSSLLKMCKISVRGFYMEICMWGPLGKYHVVPIPGEAHKGSTWENNIGIL